jgi:hypothetical protein
MNRKANKLKFIRSKNRMKASGYIEPKWVLINKKHPTQWKNTNPGLFDEAWIIDI